MKGVDGEMERIFERLFMDLYLKVSRKTIRSKLLTSTGFSGKIFFYSIILFDEPH
jgi:hypothetical protein